MPPFARCVEWKMVHYAAISTRETTPFGLSGQWRRQLAAVALAAGGNEFRIRSD
jgi:hypothetical protein